MGLGYTQALYNSLPDHKITSIDSIDYMWLDFYDDRYNIELDFSMDDVKVLYSFTATTKEYSELEDYVCDRYPIVDGVEISGENHKRIL